MRHPVRQLFRQATTPLVLLLGGLLVAAPAAGQSSLARAAQALKMQKQQEQRQKTQAQRLRLLQALFHRTLDVDFQKRPARDVFEYLGTVLDINIIGRYDDDAVGYGIDPDTPITLKAQDMLAVEVLDLALEQCAVVESCTWQLRSSFVEVGTKERLSVPAAQEVRGFPVDDLLFEPPRFDDAPCVGFGINEHPAGYGAVVGGYSGGIFPGGHGGYGGGYGPASGPAASVSIGTPQTRPNPDLARRARDLIDLIVEVIEPEAWTLNGGTWASISYNEGMLVVRAPEYVQRKIFGYPRIPPPEKPKPKPKNPTP